MQPNSCVLRRGQFVHDFLIRQRGCGAIKSSFCGGYLPFLEVIDGFFQASKTVVDMSDVGKDLNEFSHVFLVHLIDGNVRSVALVVLGPLSQDHLNSFLNFDLHKFVGAFGLACVVLHVLIANHNKVIRR